jgi:hypothetical protein
VVGTLLSTSFDAGVPLRDVQEAASHADPRTTMRYDRARGSLDRHATYIVAAYLAGAARLTPIGLAAPSGGPTARRTGPPTLDDDDRERSPTVTSTRTRAAVMHAWALLDDHHLGHTYRADLGRCARPNFAIGPISQHRFSSPTVGYRPALAN